MATDEPELDTYYTIRTLTSRADNIATGSSGYADGPAGPGIALAAGRSGMAAGA